MRKKKSIILFSVAVLMITVAAMVLPYLSQESIKNLLLHFPGIDKAAHFIEHFLMVIGIFFVLGRTRLTYHFWHRLAVSFSFSLLFSFIDETTQSLAAERSFETADIVANLLGGLSGTVTLSVKKVRTPLWGFLLIILLLANALLIRSSYVVMRPYYNGMQLEKNGKFEDAMDQYQRALKAGNTRAGLYNAIAWLDLAYLDGDKVTALNYAKKAVEKNPGHADYLDTYGLALLKNNRINEAKIWLEKAYNINPDVYTIHFHLAKVYEELGETEKAINHYLKQIEINPDTHYGKLAQTSLMHINQHNQR